MSKFELKLDPDSPIFSLGHCECDGHTENKLNQRRLTADWLAPIGQWLFTDEQQGLLWLDAKLHQGQANGSRDIQNVWILSRQSSYSTIHV